MSRSIPMSLLAAALVAATAYGAFAQDGVRRDGADAMTAAQVRATLQARGYTHVNDVEFDDGMWEADARSADGNRIEVRLDPRTGEIYPDEQVSNLGKADVEAKLVAAGYSNVHDVEFDDGVWKAEADDPSGRDVEIRLDPRTGAIIGQERD